MKATPADDAACDRMIALVIAAICHGLSLAGTDHHVNIEVVIETADRFREYIETGK